eukprot:TRINITY_DN1661_c0_g1_i1.p1 TRINITY_DN1661_c0_g1~~TRINITY_DN1661_c0_g1_i1.p1  ORF type:complete len:419 (-),score=103.23 TRINITY_DN1661_c0_g1_i1:484-1740(-)
MKYCLLLLCITVLFSVINMELIMSSHSSEGDHRLEVIVLGGYGDLSVKKIYPNLYFLYKHELIHEDVVVVGFGRRKMELEDFRDLAVSKISVPEEEKGLVELFRNKLQYHAGDVDKAESFRGLTTMLGNFGQAKRVDRLFYLALPSTAFATSAALIKDYSRTSLGWNRLIVEKPFGRDLESFHELQEELGNIWPEEDTFRIDHYLGKEMVQNILHFRFYNSIWEPLWNKDHIESIQVRFKENFGTYGRGGYFDSYGMIRDVIQNHLLQVISLVTMEAPESFDSENVRDKKVQLLNDILPINMNKVILGQYEASGENPGYLDDKTVPEGSITETYAEMVLEINNERWKGVPVHVISGKALDESLVDVRITFKNSAMMNSAYIKKNELVFKIQPNPSVSLVQSYKNPGTSDETVFLFPPH